MDFVKRIKYRNRGMEWSNRNNEIKNVDKLISVGNDDIKIKTDKKCTPLKKVELYKLVISRVATWLNFMKLQVIRGGTKIH